MNGDNCTICNAQLSYWRRDDTTHDRNTCSPKCQKKLEVRAATPGICVLCGGPVTETRGKVFCSERCKKQAQRRGLSGKAFFQARKRTIRAARKAQAAKLETA